MNSKADFFAPPALIAVVGDEVSGGTYLLRLRVMKDVAVQFGRFRNGQPVHVPVGDFLYVGSAMRGVSWRLLRHASRTDANAPHPIRAPMLAHFVQIGLLPEKIRPFPPKKRHWHIDYLLDEPAVSLTQVIIVRTRLQLETAVARWLIQQPETFILAAGLGAQDSPVPTHLLGVKAGESWWSALPGQLLLLAKTAKSAHNSQEKRECQWD